MLWLVCRGSAVNADDRDIDDDWGCAEILG